MRCNSFYSILRLILYSNMLISLNKWKHIIRRDTNSMSYEIVILEWKITSKLIHKVYCKFAKIISNISTTHFFRLTSRLCSTLLVFGWRHAGYVRIELKTSISSNSSFCSWKIGVFSSKISWIKSIPRISFKLVLFSRN